MKQKRKVQGVDNIDKIEEDKLAVLPIKSLLVPCSYLVLSPFFDKSCAYLFNQVLDRGNSSTTSLDVFTHLERVNLL